MDDKFECAKCGHDVFEEKGIVPFAGVLFRGLICEKCGNRMLLEVEKSNISTVSTSIRDDLNKITVNLK